MILFVILISVGVTSAYAINITLGGTVDITQILNMMGNKITNLGAPTQSSDAATKGYVDSSFGNDTLASLGCAANQIAQYNGTNWTCVDQVLDSDALLELSCSNDEIPKFNGTSWVCSPDVDTDVLASLGCSTNQIAQYNGTNWECIDLVDPPGPSGMICPDGFVIYGINQDGTVICKPSLFLVVPSPFGEDAFSNPRYMGVWGINLVNPTEVNMTVSKVTIVAYPSTGNDNDVIFEENCDVNMISPSADWSCPKGNTILWQNSTTPVSLPARSAVEFLVGVEPGAPSAATNIDALVVQANAFTSLGPIGNVESYQSTMRSDDTSIVNVFLTNTPELRTDFHGVQDDMGIVEKVESTLMVSLADMDDDDGTYIEDGARLIVNVPRGWTDVEITDSTGFVTNATQPSVIVYSDGSTQIIAITDHNVGTLDGPFDKDVITLTFTATPPCNEINGKKRPYIMRILADGTTGPSEDTFPIGPLNEIALIVEPEPSEINCPS